MSFLDRILLNNERIDRFLLRKEFLSSLFTSYMGDSDVGDNVMLVILRWWLIWDVGGRIIMLATFSLCWWFSQCIKSVTNILNRSPTSQTCHQHIWSSTSVTNIDVTIHSVCNIIYILRTSNIADFVILIRINGEVREDERTFRTYIWPYEPSFKCFENSELPRWRSLSRLQNNIGP